MTHRSLNHHASQDRPPARLLITCGATGLTAMYLWKLGILPAPLALTALVVACAIVAIAVVIAATRGRRAWTTEPEGEPAVEPEPLILADAHTVLAQDDHAPATDHDRAAILALLNVACETSSVDHTVRRCLTEDARTIRELRTATEGLI
ncbi:hypothetical protein ACQEU3_46545 [Spirillospora sp. CA-253888]